MLAIGNPVSPSGARLSSVGIDDSISLSPLPYGAVEARAVAAMFADDGSDVLTGSTATMERWRSLKPDRYRYLHFAAHARVSDRRPEQSSLVLSGSVMDLPTIRRLDLTAELVTLSACETGLGRRVRGEGVFGLPHAFLAAGARSVIVTLWRVGDRSTADFMGDFYRELRHGVSPAAALLAVRRAHLAAAGPASHPSRWAPFILVGAP